MINPNELRKGNWIYCKGEYEKVELIGYVSVLVKYKMPFKFETTNPIPLTPKLLEKAGFVNPEGMEYFVHKNDLNKNLAELRINTIKGKWTCSIGDDKHGIVLGFYEELHQLQNLYFALTGEELEINL